MAALLFWKRLTESLKIWGFTVNPYNWCITNKMVNGYQLTFAWHVDDLKISHKCLKVVGEIIESLKAKYGKVGEMTIRREKIHNYLG